MDCPASMNKHMICFFKTESLLASIISRYTFRGPICDKKNAQGEKKVHFLYFHRSTDPLEGDFRTRNFDGLPATYFERKITQINRNELKRIEMN